MRPPRAAVAGLRLAAIPAIPTFVGFSPIGFGAMGVTVRVPILAGIAQAADALAPRFGGRSDFLGAFELIACDPPRVAVAHRRGARRSPVRPAHAWRGPQASYIDSTTSAARPRSGTSAW